MRKVVFGMILMVLMLSLVSCSKKIKPEAMPAGVSVGGMYFTQAVIHHEKEIFPSTNYQVGAAIPINTQVKLLEITSKTISLEVGTAAQKLTVKNIPKHTGDDIFQLFNKLFAKQKVDLAQFDSLETKNINAGTVAVGMRKKAVTAAIGFPPNTRTANLEADSWVYWRNRYNTFAVNFKNGKVSDIVD